MVFADAENLLLHKSTAFQYLYDPNVTGLTNVAVAQLDRMSTEDLVAGILVPAARRAYSAVENTPDIFNSRAGGLVNRWKSHQRPPTTLRSTLLTQESSPEDDRYYSIVLAQTIPLDNLLEDLLTYCPVKNRDWKEDNLQPMRRLSAAIHLKLSSANEREINTTYRYVHERLTDSYLAKRILDTLPIDDMEVAELRNIIAVTSLMAAPNGAEQNGNIFPSALLICALSDSHPHSVIAERAADELVRRLKYNTRDREAILTVLNHIDQLPLIPETENIWRNLTTNVIKRVSDIKLKRGFVRALSERVKPTDFTTSENMENMTVLVNGLEAILEIPIEQLQKNDSEIADPGIGEEDAVVLLKKILDIYLNIPASGETITIRNSLVNLAATLAMGYTREITSESVRELVDRAWENYHDNSALIYRAQIDRGENDGLGRFPEDWALILLKWRTREEL